MSKIQVKPISIPKWHEKKGNESFTKAKVITALVDPETMTYATGLNYTDKTYENREDSKNKLTEAEYYSKILKVDLSNQFNLDEPHPFWDSKMAKIRLENRTQIFDTSKNPLDFVKVKILKASKYVANSLKEYEEGLYPEATHVIFDESEEVEVKASKVAIKNQAIAQTFNLSKGKKIELIMVLSGQEDYLKAVNAKGKSDNFVEVELDKLVTTRPTEVLNYLKMDKDELATRALVIEALQKHVFNREGHKIKYHDSVLGQDILDVVLYLNKPENSDFKLRIKEQVNK